jgi:hypothetical protein
MSTVIFSQTQEETTGAMNKSKSRLSVLILVGVVMIYN